MKKDILDLITNGYIADEKDAELFYNNVDFIVQGNHEDKRITDLRVFLFGAFEYYAEVSGMLQKNIETGEEYSTVFLSQPIRLYGPAGRATDYSNLLEMSEFVNQRMAEKRDSEALQNIIDKGVVETEAEASLFAQYAEDIVSSCDNNIPIIDIRKYLSSDGRYFCEIYGEQHTYEDVEDTQIKGVPGKIRFYGPEGEADSFNELVNMAN